MELWKRPFSLVVSICYPLGIRAVSVATKHADQQPLTLADDVQKRFSIFYLIGCVASAASGILAFGLMQMKGLQGLNGWSWIFIIEGVVRIPEYRVRIRTHHHR